MRLLLFQFLVICMIPYNSFAAKNALLCPRFKKRLLEKLRNKKQPYSQINFNLLDIFQKLRFKKILMMLYE